VIAGVVLIAASVAVRACVLASRIFSPPRVISVKPLWATDISFGEGVSGWFAEPKNGQVVVLAHGSPSTRIDLLPEAQALVARGFGVVLFDFPGHGLSEGVVAWGTPARAALTAAVGFAASHGKVGVLGFSMGSCISAQVAAQDERIAALVLEGAFTNQHDQLLYEFRAYGPLSQYPALWRAERSMNVDSMRPIEVISRLAGRPLLLIEGTADPVVPPEMSQALFEKAKEPKSLWLIEGAHHGHYENEAGAAYFERLETFFTNAL
jgi:pimeloyl-ACP methyl ester carboxylesterase